MAGGVLQFVHSHNALIGFPYQGQCLPLVTAGSQPLESMSNRRNAMRDCKQWSRKNQRDLVFSKQRNCSPSYPDSLALWAKQEGKPPCSLLSGQHLWQPASLVPISLNQLFLASSPDCCSVPLTGSTEKKLGQNRQTQPSRLVISPKGNLNGLILWEFLGMLPNQNVSETPERFPVSPSSLPPAFPRV